MNTKTSTYRFISALVLMLFISSIALPSGISAASLFCDMEKTELHTGSTGCCDIDDTEKTDHHRKNSAAEDCHSEKICLHVLSPDYSETEATISHNWKKLVALSTADKVITLSGSSENTSLSTVFTAVPNYSPPIFLLNSTFLN